MSETLRSPFMEFLSKQLGVAVPVNPKSILNFSSRPLSMDELGKLANCGNYSHGKSDLLGYILRKHMQLPTLTEAIEQATFIQTDSSQPVLRIDNVDEGVVYCHDENKAMSSHGSELIEISSLDPTKVKLLQLTNLEFRADTPVS